ncbi:MAG: ECF transporter S component [Ruminococcaceae bacterium]|nr:ECF transporter S component [Oscillospiraceae bacterium]
MQKKKVNIKNLTVAALLTAIALLIPMVMPFKLVIEPIFSATFAAHVPGILAMLTGPFAVIGTAVGSALGFFQALGNPWVSARALTHLVFGLFGFYMIKKRYNIVLVAVLSGLVHAACEMIIGLISLPFIVVPDAGVLFYILLTVGLGTFIHHCIDFAIVMVIYKPLEKAGVLPYKINLRHFKEKEN